MKTPAAQELQPEGSQFMPVRQLDTLLALKVVSLVEGLNSNSKRVAATLIEHYNRRTTRCDPGLESIGRLLGISSRTVIRAIHKVVDAGLFTKVRHGGLGNRNRYEPNWEKFEQLEAAWNDRRKSNSRSKLSPAQRQHCQLDGDRSVTQTCKNQNIPYETCPKGPSEKTNSKKFIQHHLTATAGKRSADAARDEAERRWTLDVQRRFISLPVTYAEVIDAIDETLRLAATEAELARRGAGLLTVLDRLKLGDGR